MSSGKRILLNLWQEALAAVQPGRVLPPLVPDPAPGRNIVVGMGKASAHMALTLENHFSGELSGVVAVPAGYLPPSAPRHINVLETTHPLPSSASLAAGQALLSAVSGLGDADQVIALISGGGSAAAEALHPGVTLDTLREVTQALLDFGAPIQEINALRRGLSALKGGGLARAAAPAKLTSLIISDVPGDDPGVVAGGPTVASQDSPSAVDVLQRYNIKGPVADHIAQLPAATLTHQRPLAEPNSNCVNILASGMGALEAAARLAKDRGFEVLNLGDRVQGNAAAMAREHARLALRMARQERHCVILSGGEASVTVREDAGQGGRNQTYLLHLALALEGEPGIWALAADTDGWDGTDPVAGGWINPSLLASATSRNIDVAQALHDCDGFRVFDSLDQHVLSGPTGTNVNDFRAILIAPNLAQ